MLVVILLSISSVARSACSCFVPQAMVAANPGDNASLESLLDTLQDDFVLYTKPAEESGGESRYLAL